MDRFVRKLKNTFEKMFNFFTQVDLIVAISFMLDCNFSGIGTIFYDIYSHHLAPIIFESFFKGYYYPKYRATWYFYDTIFYFSCLVNSGIEVHKFGFYHFWWRTERWAIGRDAPSVKNLGGPVVMRRAAAAQRRLLICQNLGEQLPPCPPPFRHSCTICF